MPRCPECRVRLPEERDRVGARCPRCREPLYERSPAHQGRPEAASGQCVAHPENSAVGTCQRCGNFHCAVCRTRWRGQALCLACVENSLETREAAPEEARTHFQQALASLLCGLGGWALGLIGLVLAAVAVQAGPDGAAVVAIFPAAICLLLSPLLSVPGLGLGLAAIRSRGDHLILATAGLILSGLQAGVLIGLLSVGLWRS